MSHGAATWVGPALPPAVGSTPTGFGINAWLCVGVWAGPTGGGPLTQYMLICGVVEGWRLTRVMARRPILIQFVMCWLWGLAGLVACDPKYIYIFFIFSQTRASFFILSNIRVIREIKELNCRTLKPGSQPNFDKNFD